MADVDLTKLTISELAPRNRAREVSPVEVTEAALAQVDRLQPRLNSFITILHDQALSRARKLEAELARGEYRGPLHGIPIGVKDNIATGGVRSTVGSKILADHVPNEDAHTVGLCIQAGAILLGKENLEEFASSGITSNNPHYGAVHNPWDLDCIPGGSSGGSAANVAAGVTFASIGTDLGGSVRLPSTFCGVVGLVSTFGRISQRGLMGTSFNGDRIGPLTRTVGDCALMLGAMAGYNSLDPSTIPVPVPDYTVSLESGLRGLKMSVPANYYFDLVDPEVEAAVRRGISDMEKLGVEPREVTIPSVTHFGARRIEIMTDLLVNHEAYIEAGHREDYGPWLLYQCLAAQCMLGRDYAKALKVQRIIKDDFARLFEEVDFLVTPTAPVPAPRIEQATFNLGSTEYQFSGPGSGMIGRNTGCASTAGIPAISVPCGFSQSGLPIGLHLIGRPFDEATLLRVAHGYEAVSPARGRRPAIVDGIGSNQ